MSKDSPVSGKSKSQFPKSLNPIFPAVNFPGRSIFTKNIQDVHISAICNAQPRLIRQMIKWRTETEDGE